MSLDLNKVLNGTESKLLLSGYENSIESFLSSMIENETSSHEKILLLNATKVIRDEMDTLHKEIQDQIALFKNRVENVSYRLMKQIQTYQLLRKLQILEVSNQTWSIRVLFQNIMSFLPIISYTIIQKVSKFWRQELFVIIDVVENKFLKNENLIFRRKRFPISLQWMSCLIFSYPDLGQQQSLVYPNLAFVSSLQFWNSSLNMNSSILEVVADTEWLRLHFENREITDVHKIRLNYLMEFAITKFHSKLFALLMKKNIVPTHEQIKKYFSIFKPTHSIADTLYEYKSYLHLTTNDFFVEFIINSASPSEWLEKWLYKKDFNPFKAWHSTSFLSPIEMWPKFFRKDFYRLAAQFNIKYNLEIRTNLTYPKIYYTWFDKVDENSALLLHQLSISKDLGD